MSKFLSALAASTSRKEIATTVVDIQTFLRAADKSVKVNTVGTLVKKSVEDLQTMVSSLLGDHLTLDDDGAVVPVEIEEEAPAEEAAEEEAPAARRGGRALQADDAVITVLVASNPKREGSANYARFALLQTGMTVAAYIAAVETAGYEKARRTLRKAVARGLVRVD